MGMHVYGTETLVKAPPSAGPCPGSGPASRGRGQRWADQLASLTSWVAWVPRAFKHKRVIRWELELHRLLNNMTLVVCS